MPEESHPTSEPVAHLPAAAGPTSDRDAAFLAAAARWVAVRLHRAAHAADPAWGRADEAEWREARRGFEEAAARRPAFVEIVERCKLTTFEAELLLLCLANEITPAIPDLCAR